ncbi:hypothetical protein [Ostreiculturibacter nitratireducens]|uniref:hypothetical protein n=1 Tax=Ostreiculturibacter nitratireducens TaxID=3075226 RepID=UPI0031B63601
MVSPLVFLRFRVRPVIGVMTAVLAIATGNAVAETVEVVGEVTEVDLSALAFDGPTAVKVRTAGGGVETITVPSQGRNLCAARANLAPPEELRAGALVSVLGTRSEDGAIVPCGDESHSFHLLSRHSVQEHGFRFTFRVEPAGYAAVPATDGQSPDLMYGLSLMVRDDLDTFSEDAGARDGPKSITIEIYDNSPHLHAPVWVDRNKTKSHVDLARSPIEETVLAGANAVRYRTDGLYQNEHIVAAHDSKIFVFTVAYDSLEDDIYLNFIDLLSTFEFIPSQ